MTIQRIDTGSRSSKAVVHNGTVYLGGLVAETKAGASVAEQTAEILSQIDDYLSQCGTHKTKLLRAEIWITDMRQFDEMNAAWESWLPPGQSPARTIVKANLAAPEYSVEIMVVAAT